MENSTNLNEDNEVDKGDYSILSEAKTYSKKFKSESFILISLVHIHVQIIDGWESLE